ncbi:NAD(P)/FAD-dependent oxidoreductase [Wenzhouxiangella sediminis]|uniref:Ferredoxin--NADP reductase n=1 Tax=Wenzhouxiangella sediminis TaxID=1792836 RepID=A0A3E1K6H5_9GAMM|nr:NAD(P)/FAD-dependent oxidoreductase [Wenzhouxiangella sediminis]RFF29633.1 NAD(P)/FAD-dependent oxidoreductase [Wenzhouxiangella sediminis]
MTIQTDAVIVGAGPVGLFQVFELGLLGLKAELVDSLPQVGGQCAELYPEKPIYDIPAWPVIGAQELVDKLMQQIKPFHAGIHLGQRVEKFEKREDGRFTVVTSTGTEFDAGAVIIAAGLGAFQARKLKAKGIDEVTSDQIHYKVTNREQFRGKRLLILGGGDSALDWTMDLAEIAESVELIHRRNEYRGAAASVEKVRALAAEGKVRERQGIITQVHSEDGRFTGFDLMDLERNKSSVEGDEVLVFWGLSPDLGPIADWGLDLEKKQIPVDTEKFQTSVEGVFAIGDVNTYPGKKKFILSGFHEAALAAFGVQKYVYPDARQFVQYTTTSPIMHKRLGVADE